MRTHEKTEKLNEANKRIETLEKKIWKSNAEELRAEVDAKNKSLGKAEEEVKRDNTESEKNIDKKQKEIESLQSKIKELQLELEKNKKEIAALEKEKSRSDDKVSKQVTVAACGEQKPWAENDESTDEDDSTMPTAISTNDHNYGVPKPSELGLTGMIKDPCKFEQVSPCFNFVSVLYDLWNKSDANKGAIRFYTKPHHAYTGEPSHEVLVAQKNLRSRLCVPNSKSEVSLIRIRNIHQENKGIERFDSMEDWITQKMKEAVTWLPDCFQGLVADHYTFNDNGGFQVFFAQTTGAKLHISAG